MELPGGNCENGIAKTELPGGNCEKAIVKTELPGGNCKNTIVKMELPSGNCKNTFSFYSCRHLKPLCTYATTPTLLAIGCEVRIINSRTFFLLNSNLLLFLFMAICCVQ